MKVVLVLLDGLGDRTYAALGHQSPLEAARTPNLDRLAKMGMNGVFHAGPPWRCLPSEAAHFAMFGYDPDAFPGRGLLEASGAGIEFGDADVPVLAHLSGVRTAPDPQTGGNILVLEYGRDDIPGKRNETGRYFDALAPWACEGFRFELHQTGRNDAILVVKGANGNRPSPDISDSDPVGIGMPMGRITPLAESTEPEAASMTADAVNQYLDWCHERLNGTGVAGKNPGSRIRANFLATQRAGRRVSQEPFLEKWGFRAAMIASVAVYRGLARELGLDFIRAEDTDAPGADLAGRVGLALDDTAHEFIHVHTKAPDEASHKGDPLVKTRVIEELDQGLAGLVQALESGNQELLVVVTADHSTPARQKLIHSGESVPVAIAGGAIRQDRIERFDEISAVRGSAGFLRGDDLMHMILNCTNRAVLDGLRLGSVRRPYRHRDYPPFVVEKRESEGIKGS